MHSIIAAAAFLLFSATYALPEILITKRDAKRFVKSPDISDLIKREGGTVGTNVFEVLTWNFGGAYYANGTHTSALDAPAPHMLMAMRVRSHGWDPTPSADCTDRHWLLRPILQLLQCVRLRAYWAQLLSRWYI